MTTHQRTFKCPCGLASTITLGGIGCYNINEARNILIGWKPVFLSDGGTAWLCPECNKKATDAAKIIIDVVKDDLLHFRSLLRP